MYNINISQTLDRKRKIWIPKLSINILFLFRILSRNKWLPLKKTKELKKFTDINRKQLFYFIKT